MEAHFYLLSVTLIVLFFTMFVAIKQYRKKHPLASSKVLSPAKKPGIEEKRTHPRYKTSLRIKYKSPFRESKESILEGVSWIKDISRGGMRLFFDKHLDKGAFLTLEINLPFDKQPVFAQSSVVWKEGDDAGVIFDEVGEGDLDKILEYIDNRAQISSLKMK